MKIRVFIFSVIALISSFTALRAQPAAAVQPLKIAVFDSDMLNDEKAGIKKLVTAFRSLEAEIKPRKDELVTLKAKYDLIVKQIQDTQKTAPAITLQAKADEAEILKRDIERKQQDGQQFLDKRMKEVTGPIYQEIGNALQAFAKQRGIDIIYDMAKLNEAMMVVNPAVDITPAFITDFNAKNTGVPAGVPVK
jgi:Skp family chaperone for outer membrane proteins